MIDEKDLVYAIELRQSLAKKNGQMFVDMTYEIVSNILALLKEQEAVKPINSYGTFRCRKCKNIVGYNDGDGRGYQNNFCSKCGQAVKWE